MCLLRQRYLNKILLNRFQNHLEFYDIIFHDLILSGIDAV